jgi:hypothetical protein
MTDNLEAKLCFGCHYSAKIVDLFDAELADLFALCANIVNCWYMKYYSWKNWIYIENCRYLKIVVGEELM